MDKARTYIFLIVLGAAGILLLFSTNVSQRREAVAETNISAWGGGADLRLSGSYSGLSRATALQEREDFDQAKIKLPIFSHKIPSANVSRGAASQGAAPRPHLEGDSSPSNQAVQTRSASYNSLFENAYSFIPKGFISTSISQTPAKTRTPEEKSYFDYGNAVGLEIQAFDNSHKETMAILDTFFKDYNDRAKKDALLSIARDYERLVADLSAIKNVPAGLSEMHISLSEGYRAISNGLSQLTNAKSDQEMAKAVLAYNASADIFIKRFVVLADFFSSKGIRFASSDLGVIFQFSN